MTTWPHPGFATDMQPQFCALMTQATGPSVISEALYENRFGHVELLQQMGAHIAIHRRSAVINGPARLHGARMTIPDIRSGAALVIAGLCAEGTTELDRVSHLERDYNDLANKLAGLGADIERVVTGPGPKCAISPA
jgi:UDP-N-acetylglucosamine 1-carboxyvinyltransferase